MLRDAKPVRLLLAVVAGLLMLVPGTPAWAHNALAEASPEKKATLKKSPTEVKLRFLQKLDPDDTVITVSDSGQQQVPASEPSVSGSTGTIKFEQALPNGVYTVAYQVVSTDGHAVKGSYEFTVAGPSAQPSSTPASPVADASPVVEKTTPIAEKAAPEETSSGNGAIIAVVVAAVVVLAGLAGFLYARRRKA